MNDGRIDWAELLVGRPCPPNGWWVGLAIERDVDALELRASAAVALLAPPLQLSPGRAPYLKELPRLAKEWIGICQQQDAFCALGAEGLKAAERNLAIATAARDAMEDHRAPGMVPELEELRSMAGALVDACTSNKTQNTEVPPSTFDPAAFL